MKTEQLKEWGLDERQIGMVMRENGRDVETVKARFADYETLKAKVTQLEEAAASSLSADELRQQALQWQAKAEETEKIWKQKWEKRDFDEALQRSLHQAGARNEKAVRALLQEESLFVRDDGALEGLEEQLFALKSEHGYLFGPDQAPPRAIRPAGQMQARADEQRVREIMGLSTFETGKDDF
ncbi:MAG: phage scaffolding protein [Oscillospiraceae bacterium]|nr:phage scaffolding protein [Oscillospiraceae bacterium]